MVENPPAFQCKGHGFDPWSGNQDPSCCGAIKPMPKLEKPSHCNEGPVLQKKRERERERERECIVGQPLREISVIP